MVADVIDRYPRCRIDGTRWILVELLDRIMPEIGPKLAEFATEELRGRGIEIRTGTRLEAVEEDAATLSTGERIPTRTVCWTAGVAPPPLVRELGLPLTEGGRVEVEPTLRVSGHENIWAIGDTAAVPDPSAGGQRATPPTAQHALRQGRLVADNVASALGHGQPRPFRYKTRGVFVDMGRHKAVVSTPVVRFRGFPAWFAARTYHLLMMPGLGRKLRLMLDWTVGLFFGRASAELGLIGHPQALDAPRADEPAEQDA
jgi:NADH dehydrogenase